MVKFCDEPIRELHIRAGRYKTACGIEYYRLTDHQATAAGRTIPNAEGRRRIRNNEIQGLCHNCLQAFVNFNMSPQEYLLIAQIAKRAINTSGSAEFDLQQLEMDITAVHLNDCKLDLVKFLNFSNGDFWHDILGIRQHINRLTGRLENGFAPRCSA